MDPFTAVSAGTQLFGAAFSVIQGIKAKREQRKAEQSARQALSAAKRAISTNYIEGVQLPIDAFENEMNANTAASMQALDMLAEGGQRSAIGAVGKVHLATAKQNETIRERMQSDLANLDFMKRKEDSRIAGLLGDISLQEAEGAQIAAMNAEQSAAAAFTSAVTQAGDAGLTAYQDSALYGDRNRTARRAKPLSKIQT